MLSRCYSLEAIFSTGVYSHATLSGEAMSYSRQFQQIELRNSKEMQILWQSNPRK